MAVATQITDIYHAIKEDNNDATDMDDLRHEVAKAQDTIRTALAIVNVFIEFQIQLPDLYSGPAYDAWQEDTWGGGSIEH